MNSFSEREQVKQYAEGLSVGESNYAGVCPWCGGGSSHDKSFSVTRSASAILYKCHRAKCGAKGVIGERGAISLHTSSTSKPFDPTRYSKAVCELSPDKIKVLGRKYGLSPEQIEFAGWVEATEEGGEIPLAMPILSPTGDVRGVSVRSYDSKGRKRVRIYKMLDEPLLCWYRQSSSSVVVVEDQISALRASGYCTAVAVLGTNIDYEKIAEIGQVVPKTGKVYIALDKDASAKAFEYLRLYRAVIPNISILLLPEDIKDMTHEEIVSLAGPFER